MVHIVKCGPADIAASGAYAWQLPPDATCARHARSLARQTLTALNLDELADSVTLAVSELVTNALRHATPPGPRGPVAPAELWIWTRAIPRPVLVTGVFDTCRTAWPHHATGAPPRSDATLPSASSGVAEPATGTGRSRFTGSERLEECGRGLGLVTTVSQEWGAHLTRSRLGAGRVPGKVVWATFPLPAPWPDPGLSMSPATAARYLADVLAACAVDGVGRYDGHGVSLVSVPLTWPDCVNVWIGPSSVSLTDTDGTRMTRPLLDLQDVAEHLISRIEERTDA